MPPQELFSSIAAQSRIVGHPEFPACLRPARVTGITRDRFSREPLVPASTQQEPLA